MSERITTFEGLRPEVRPYYRTLDGTRHLANAMQKTIRMISRTENKGELVRGKVPKIKSPRELHILFDDTTIQELMRDGVGVKMLPGQKGSLALELKFGPVIVQGFSPYTYLTFHPFVEADFLRLYNRANSLEANLEVFERAVNEADVTKQIEAIFSMKSVIEGMILHEQAKKEEQKTE